jgi:hypothetical protein
MIMSFSHSPILPFFHSSIPTAGVQASLDPYLPETPLQYLQVVYSSLTALDTALHHALYHPCPLHMDVYETILPSITMHINIDQ